MIFTYHGLFFGLGAVVTALVYERLVVRLRLNYPNYGYDILIVFMAGLVGARLAYALVFGTTGWLDALSFWRVGMISWGGILGGLLAAGLLYQKREERGHWFDLLILAAVPGWVVGRLGNFLQQDAFGVKSDLWPSLFYGRVPVPLLEIIGLFAIWFLGLRILKKSKQPGATGLKLIWGYAVIRLLVDQYRELPDLWLNLNLGQWTAVVVICAIITIWIIRNKHI